MNDNAKAIIELFERYEDVERITISGGDVEVKYSDGSAKAPSIPLLDHLEACPFLRDGFVKNKLVIVLVRPSKDEDGQ
jgi:hypothetical protein